MQGPHIFACLNVLFFLEANALGAQEKVLEIASRMGIRVTVGVAHQFDVAKAGINHVILITKFVKSTSFLAVSNFDLVFWFSIHIQVLVLI